MQPWPWLLLPQRHSPCSRPPLAAAGAYNEVTLDSEPGLRRCHRRCRGRCRGRCLCRC